MNNQNFDQHNYYPPGYIYETNTPRIDLGAIFRSKLFLALCIMFTISFAADIFQSTTDLIQLLLLIGLWMCFHAGQNSSNHINTSGLKLISGTLLANIILFWIMVVSFAIGGVAVLVKGITTPLQAYNGINDQISALLAPGGDIFNEIYRIDELRDILNSSIYQKLINFNWEAIISMALVAIGIIFLITSALMALFNVLIYQKLRGFTSSLVTSIQTNTDQVEYAKWASCAFLILAIIKGSSVVTALGNILYAMPQALACATFIIAHIFIKTYFIAPFKDE